MARLDVSLPLSVPVTKRGKPWYINLNNYRNDHNSVLHKAKVVFAQLALALIGRTKLHGPVRLTYTLYYGTARRIDLANVCSVADKFFSDALTAAGTIEDDNSSVVREVRFVWGGIDRLKPRIDVSVEELDALEPVAETPEKQQRGPEIMRILLSQAEMGELIAEHIHDIVEDHVRNTFNFQEGVSLDIRDTEDGGVEVSIVKGDAAGQSTEAPAGTELTKGQRAAATRKANREAAAAAAQKAAQQAQADQVTQAVTTQLGDVFDKETPQPDAAAKTVALDLPTGTTIAPPSRVPVLPPKADPVAAAPAVVESAAVDPLQKFYQPDGTLREATPEEWQALTEDQQTAYSELKLAQGAPKLDLDTQFENAVGKPDPAPSEKLFADALSQQPAATPAFPTGTVPLFGDAPAAPPASVPPAGGPKSVFANLKSI